VLFPKKTGITKVETMQEVLTMAQKLHQESTGSLICEGKKKGGWISEDGISLRRDHREAWGSRAGGSKEAV